jgi:hypothetical protein
MQLAAGLSKFARSSGCAGRISRKRGKYRCCKCLEEHNQAKQKLEAAHDAVVAEGLKKKDC